MSFPNRAGHFAVLSVVAVPAFLFSAQPRELHSRVREVTVFSDRAMVTRVARTSFDPGTHIVRFGALPASIDRNSIQLDGTGDAILEDVTFERQHLTHTPSRKERRIRDSLTLMNDSLAGLQAIVEHAGREKDFVLNIAKRLTHGAEKEAAPVLDPAKWAEMVSFYRGRLDDLDQQTRVAEKGQRHLRQEIDRLNRELRDISGEQRMYENQVLATITARKQTDMTLELSYVVGNARWRPAYDIRVNSETRTLELVYKGKISQNTSEEWENVKVVLSTARPEAGDGPPELSPWYLSVRTPAVQSRKPRALSAPRAMMKMADKATGMESEAAAPMALATSNVQSRATSAVFVPQSTTTISNDNTESTVAIASLSLPVTLAYSALPKLSPNAFLKATSTNSSEYPLLPGRTSVFLDGSFVTDGEMELIAPSERFEAFLGADEGVRVEHKLVKRYESKEGVLTRKQKVMYEYEITFENRKSKPIALNFQDQIPVSTNSEIEVELLSPDLERNSVTKDEMNYLKWKVELEPGQKKTIPLVFAVSFPRDMEIDGL